MPLPTDTDNLTWPPPAHQAIHDTIRRWNAWYLGDRDLLAEVYGNPQSSASGVTHYRNGTPHRGGAVGTAYRLFWGRPVLAGTQQPTRLHVPAAADIAQTSAELLFSEPPTLTVDQAAQARVDELFGPRMWDLLLNAASVQAGLGGVFLRVGWDQRQVPDRPLLDVIGPDHAVPRFGRGRLTDVTFTWALADAPHGKVIRHLEHHSLIGGRGFIEHGLFEGSGEKLGRRIPLESHPDTEPLASLVNADSVIPTGLPMLDVIYVANRVATGWRSDPVGAYQGQADVAVVERSGLLDALDEVFSSWMRDIRLGKARAVTAQDYLTSAGPGRGALFDLDQELFVGINRMPASGGDPKPVELIQAEIRWEAHRNSYEATYDQVIDGCGYSAHTFGRGGDVAITATESNARDRKTGRTRGGKVRDWSVAIPDLCELMLAVDREHLGGEVGPVRPAVEFPPMTRDSLETLARTMPLLEGSMSTFERVSILHPSWDDKQKQAEVDLIGAEQAARTPTDLLVDPRDNPDDG